MEILEYESMSKHTTYKIGGPARFFIEPKDTKEIFAALSFARKKELPYYIMSNGSNLLVSDLGFDGVVIKLKQFFRNYEIKDEMVKAEAGIGLHQLIEIMAGHGLGGIEKLSSIPGSLGGAIVMNAGAYGDNIAQSIVEVKVIEEGKEDIQTLSRAECHFTYRHSIFQETSRLIVIEALLRGIPKSREEILQTMEEIKEKRKAHPQQPSAGSVFRNPDGGYAGKIIESLNLRGLQVGQAQISPKHGNFIVNLGGAKAEDVFRLIKIVQEKAASIGFQMKLEVKLLGDFSYIN